MNPPSSFAIACADIGSVARGRFGWAITHRFSAGGRAGVPEEGKDPEGGDLKQFACTVAKAIQRGRVALGFECPMWVPVAGEPAALTASRCIDRKPSPRPWSAGAGAAVLTVGLTQVASILKRIKECAGECPPVFFDWPSFRDAQRGVFFWEAFVTGGGGKTKKQAGSHVADAKSAIREFERLIDSSGTGDPTPGRCVDCEEPNCKDEVDVRSLVGGALLWAGWSSDVRLMHQQCIVIRTIKELVEESSPQQ